ncbi:MAG: hypothetical protein MZV64_62720 [Ignavibacteriales bacterium]|nr:hypothetical protein [Ignavibacteriales bacterium]
MGLVLQSRLLPPGRRQRAPHDLLALPPMAFPQTWHLETTVWNAGMCRLRTLYHLVPG